jgi:hypothetical protein
LRGHPSHCFLKLQSAKIPYLSVLLFFMAVTIWQMLCCLLSVSLILM